MTHSDRIVGAHLSVAGGYTNAVQRAQEIGANGLQIFSGSPRVWARPAIVPAQLEAFKKASDQANIRALFVHALYLVNLASEKPESVQKSKNVLIHDLKFGAHFDCQGVVIHLGSHQGRGWEAVRDSLADSIQEIIDAAKSPVPFLIENSAGQNGKLCSNLEEIRWLLDKVNRPTLGWCYDTCHGWAAGYKAQERDYGAEGRGSLFAELEKYDLWDSLKCFHVNDSRDGFATGRDRHANIGQGEMAPGEIAAVINHPKLKHVPIMTEVPGLEKEGPDAPNVAAIRALLRD